ncbi:amidohydrolase [Roseomonas nepalensis]|uniref:Amidohydrolase n=1 Tax=Muricoccus nepalensis TaxID=1854500 RepID=A0A502GFB4_9PROT|nr:amidohydrolase family protein [Roseomonas nepalensis]TPG59746.1 amidohydrolase [Roseomonas nepalensis]
MIIDIHAHTFCPAVEPLLRDQPGHAAIPYKRDIHPDSAATDAGQAALLREPFNDLARRRADMARMRVDAQLVAPAPGQQHYWAEPALLARVSAMQNDHVAGLVAEAPGLLAGLGTLPMADVPAAIAEARRAAEGLGLRGFQIDSRVNERELSDPAFDPLWEELSQLGAVLVIHPLGFSDGARLGPFFMVNTVGQPLEETIAFHHLVLGGVLDRHPGLKVLICHGGGYVPSYVGRLDHAWEHRPELRRLIPRPPSAYLPRLFFDTCVFRPDLIENLVRLAGAERVMLGSDYPFDMGDPDPLATLDAAGALPAADRAAIAGGNAARLFRMAPPPA